MPHPIYSKEDLEKIDLGVHHEPQTFSDKIAYTTVRILRVLSDQFFRKRYLHRAVVLETIAAVPGMVAGMWRHLGSLRRMQRDHGWIHTLLEEAENERIHLLTWMAIVQPTLFERLLVITAQGVFWNCYLLFYILSPTTAHRFVGYLEEEAVITYTHMLEDIDKGIIPLTPAPRIAKNYWKLPEDATIRDVTLVIRADESIHRDMNHEFSQKAAHPLRENNHIR